MGGFIALDLAINYPKRIDNLILVGTNARSVSKERRILLKKSLLELNNKNYIERFSTSSFQSYFAKKNQNKKNYLKLIKIMVKDCGIKCLARQTNAILHRPKLIEKLAKIKSRCLIISGSQDRLSTKEMNMELHNKIKNSEIYFVTKSGHFVMLEEFEKFNKKILSWLN
jgi:pimeloyl-ACP methyl ester carboxylesterase